MNGNETKLTPFQNLVSQLLNYEGDYHYPAGLLRQAAERITALESDLTHQRESLSKYIAKVMALESDVARMFNKLTEAEQRAAAAERELIRLKSDWPLNKGWTP